MISKFSIALLKNHKRSMIGLLCIGIGESLATLGIAMVFAHLVSALFLQQVSLHNLTLSFYGLIGFGILKAILHYMYEFSAQKIGGRIKEMLRRQIIDKVYALGGLKTSSDPIHLLTEGLDQVEEYMVRYIPQILYAALIPLVMGLCMITSVPWVGIILLISFPLIPFFMIMIGKKAEKMNQEQWERMSFLTGHFLDVLQGLTTLKIFDRAREQVYVIDRLAGEFKDSTLRVLRVAFLSALVLELLSTISTALIAGYLGVALVFYEVEFLPAFTALLLAPEFYAPLRQLGSAFHTGMAGNVSLEKAENFLQLSEYVVQSGTNKVPVGMETISFKDVTFFYDQDYESRYTKDETELSRETHAVGNKKELSKKKPRFTDGKLEIGEANHLYRRGGIEEINIILQKGHKIMLVGESGAGKTTISHLLMRLIDPMGGEILVDNRSIHEISLEEWRKEILYVPQDPYLFKGSILENIAFGLNRSIEEVVEAAKRAFIHDEILAMPQGYHTPIGEGGLGVSGGQRQRIALARAFLRPGKILILDEATARLDVETEWKIGQALEDICKERIVLMIGHRMQTMKWADRLYVIKDGSIVQEGTFAELKDVGYFKELVDAGTIEREVTVEREATGELFDAEKIDGVKSAFKETSLITKSEEARGFKEGQTREDGESCHKERVYVKTLFSVLKRAKTSLFLSIGLSFLTVFMNVGLLTTSAWLIASAALHPELVYLSVAIVGVRFFGISRAVCRYGERYVSHHMAFQGLHALRVWFYTRLEPLVPALFAKYSTGDLLARIMADIEILQFFYLRVLIPPASALLLTIIGVIFWGQFSWTISLTLLLFAFLGGVAIPLSVMRFTNPESYLHERSQVKSLLVDQVKGLIDTIAYGQEKSRIGALVEAFTVEERVHQTMERRLLLGETIFLWLSLLAWPIGILLTDPLVVRDGLSGVYFAVVAISLGAYFECLQPMMQAALHGRESMGAMRRLYMISEDGREKVNDDEKSMHQVDVDACLVDTAVNEKLEETKNIAISFQNVAFKYGRKEIYKNLNLSIRKGERVAIVGPSGAGKSTLLHLVEKFYPYDGQIALNGRDIQEIDNDTLRRQISYMTQDAYVFHATIEDNIRLAKPKAVESEIKEAIRLAQLTDWVESLPKKDQTMIGMGGMGISGGQKQRIAIARLALKEAPLILLDEPLEGLDLVTRNSIESAIFTLMEHRTTLYVTHHLKGLDKMDRIVFMDHGQIIEEGSYEELIRKEGEFYKYAMLTMATF